MYTWIHGREAYCLDAAIEEGGEVSFWRPGDGFVQIDAPQGSIHQRELSETEYYYYMVSAGRKIAFLGLVSLLAAPAHTTTVVAILQKTDNGPVIVLGADGLRAQLDEGTGTTSFISSCKIAKIGSFYYVAAGPIYNPDRSFDVYRDLRGALSVDGTFENKTQAFEHDVLAQMNDIKSWPPGLTVVEVLIFDTSQFPVYYLAIFSRTDRGWSIIPGNGIRTSFPLNTRIVTLGTRDRILPILGNQFQSATKRVKELIGIEEAAHPDAVGEPISVIEFSRNGPQWLQAGACK